ncbi:MAG: TonB-dependent receptor, partial [Bacteroidia bacterium]|nr:TonB-dependent receptor [Bacteroidia bacterium]
MSVTKDELIRQLEELARQEMTEEVTQKADELKNEYLRLSEHRNQELLEQFIAEGGVADDFEPRKDPDDGRFAELMHILQDRLEKAKKLKADEVQTQLNNNGQPAYIAALGNVPEVRTKGLELDVAYFGIPYTTLRFAGAYSDARYRSFPRAPTPAELGGANPAGPYYDASGKTLPGVPKVSGNLFAKCSYPISNDWVFNSNLNYNYQGSYYADTRLSRYARTDAFGVTDFSIGLARADGRFGVSLVAKNLFDVDIGIPLTWNSYKPG